MVLIKYKCVTLISAHLEEASLPPSFLKITGRPITLLECVEADSVGAGKLNLTYENAEALKAEYFYLLFKRRLK